MSDSNNQLGWVEYGVLWVYPDGEIIYSSYGYTEDDKNKAFKALKFFPDRLGSHVVQRTVTYSKWQKI